ncbi:hypothetical protein FRC11_001908, partial [Ceratobasidium sp. 423]
MLHSPKEFRQAFAGLMMMDRDAFGYDTAFTVEHTPGGRVEYYVDLPATAFSSDDIGLDAEPATSTGDPAVGASVDSAHQSPTLRQYPTRKFKVMERLYHCRSICGRSTIVLRLREVQKRTEHPESEEASSGPMTRSRTRSNRDEPKWEEVPGGHDYALKLMWRDRSKPQEGELLKRLVGEYGVAQCHWYSDVLRWNATCHEPEATSCDVCCDTTPAQAVVQQVQNLADLDIEVALGEDGNEPKYAQTVEVNTDDYVRKLYTHRTARIYSWVLLSTVGRLLWTAESPRQFLEAVLDGMLGYWQTFNNGILHRDISDGNVLIAEPGQGYDIPKWKPEWGSTVQEDSQPMIEAQNRPLAESRRLAQETIAQLDRDPTGFLSDYDLAATHSGMESAIFGRAPKESGDSSFRTSNSKRATHAEPNAKRLRQDEDIARVSSTSGASHGREGQKPDEFNSSPVTVSGHKSYKPIDFRTGTPTFMSIRVLRVKLGARYDHHFMDDLESFFWLIL